MDVGPVDVLVVEFPGNKFSGEIAPALGDLVRSGTVRVLDLLFVIKDADGSVGSLKLQDLGPELGAAFGAVEIQPPGGMLEDEDAEVVAEGLEPNSSAAILVWENTWAARFVTAMRNADAQVVDFARIPADVVASALEG